MKVVILAGGFGTRIYPYSNTIPKPLIKIKGIPIIEHIINLYFNYGFKDFLIATGHKKKKIEKNFKKKKFRNLNIQCIDTGKNTMTGGRILLLKNFLKETFLLTYGDGLSNVNIRELIKFHKKNLGIATLTAVRPPARFGEILINQDSSVRSFKEKPQASKGRINGGFFVMEPEIISYIKNSKTYLEREPLEKLSKIKKLFAFKHNGFWQCMDTIRDKIHIDEQIKLNNGIYPWLIK
jgi:glucose-1-phosphate cytidylyltransferase